MPFDIVLNPGEGYLGNSALTGLGGSLTGTIISADRPVGLINGNRCTNVPQGASFFDHIFEVAQPVVSCVFSSINR